MRFFIIALLGEQVDYEFKVFMNFGRNIKIYFFILVVTFIFAKIVLGNLLHMQESHAKSLGLPEPTEIVKVSKNYSLPLLKGLRIDPNNPLNIEFFVDTNSQTNLTEMEGQKLINYFLTGLVVPAEDLWVNLSPYEQNRIITDSLSNTDAGKDLLAQDYLLKQLTSSLTHPETKIGQEYWKTFSLHEGIQDNNNLNKVWIVPDAINLFESGSSAFILDASLDIKSEHSNNSNSVLIPEIRKDVNKGKNFAKLRQVYHSLILATWFKEKFKKSFYRSYINSNNISGIELNDKSLKQKIYSLYCESFEKGVYKLIKRSNGSDSHSKKNNKYFSGGAILEGISSAMVSENLDSNIERINGTVNGELYRVVASALKGKNSNVNDYLKMEMLTADELTGLNFKIMPGSKPGAYMACLEHDSYPGLVFKTLKASYEGENHRKSLFEDKILPGVKLSSLISEYATKTKVIKSVSCEIDSKPMIIDILVQEKVIMLEDIMNDDIGLDDNVNFKTIIDDFFEIQYAMWDNGVLDKDPRIFFNYGYNLRRKKVEIFDFDELATNINEWRVFKQWLLRSEINSLDMIDPFQTYYDSLQPSFEDFSAVWKSKPSISGGVDLANMEIELSSSSVEVTLADVNIQDLDKFCFVVQSIEKIKTINNE